MFRFLFRLHCFLIIFMAVWYFQTARDAGFILTMCFTVNGFVIISIKLLLCNSCAFLGEKSFWKSFLLMFCKPALFMLLTVKFKEVIFGTIRVSTLDFESNWQWQQRSWRTGPWFTQSLVCGLDYTQQKVTVNYQKRLPDKQFVPYGQTLGISGFLKHNKHACWICLNK